MTTQLMTTQLSPDRAGLPPPLQLDLIDAGRLAGWIMGDAVGFRGFADEVEAAHAAWLAYRTLARRLARTHGTRPIPIDTEPLALQRQGDEEVILASGRAIGTLLRPGTGSRSGPDSFGFEIRIPAPADELQVRAMAHLMYRTLRRSGIRWALWRPAAERADGATAAQPGAARAGDGTNNVNRGERDVTEHPRQRAWRPPARSWRRAGRLGRAASPRRIAGAPSATTFVAKVIFAAIGVVMAVTLTATAPQTVTVPLAVVLAAGLVASGLIVAGDRWLAGRRRRRGSRRRSATLHATGRQPNGGGRDEHQPDAPVAAARWGALGVLSLALLGLALLAPEGLGVALAAIGLAALMVFRLAAMYGDWLPRGPIPAGAPSPLDDGAHPIPL